MHDLVRMSWSHVAHEDEFNSDLCVNSQSLFNNTAATTPRFTTHLGLCEDRNEERERMSMCELCVCEYICVCVESVLM